jgi:hypothetical protein
MGQRSWSLQGGMFHLLTGAAGLILMATACPLAGMMRSGVSHLDLYRHVSLFHHVRVCVSPAEQGSQCVPSRASDRCVFCILP